MTSWLPYDVQSLLPRSSPQTSGLPTPGDAAPEIPRSSIVVNGGSVSPYSGPSLGTIIAFVRHCGCPFAEKEIRMLGEVRKRHDEREVQIVVVQHSDEGQTREWWSTIGGQDLIPDAKLIADPERDIYARFGIGVLSWGGLFSRSMLTELQSLRKEGIVNTKTGKGSWRWQGSGGLSVNSEGKVLWGVKVSKDAGDVCPYDTDILASLATN